MVLPALIHNRRAVPMISVAQHESVDQLSALCLALAMQFAVRGQSVLMVNVRQAVGPAISVHLARGARRCRALMGVMIVIDAKHINTARQMVSV